MVLAPRGLHPVESQAVVVEVVAAAAFPIADQAAARPEVEEAVVKAAAVELPLLLLPLLPAPAQASYRPS